MDYITLVISNYLIIRLLVCTLFESISINTFGFFITPKKVTLLSVVS